MTLLNIQPSFSQTRDGRQIHPIGGASPSTDNKPVSDFVNILGDTNLLEVQTRILKAKVSGYGILSQAQSLFSKLAVDVAKSSGDHIVASARETLQSNIVSGCVNLGVGVAASTVSVRASKQVSTSIKQNKRVAAEMRKTVGHTHADSASPLNLKPKGKVNSLNPTHEKNALGLEHKHDAISHKAQSRHTIAQSVNQGNQALSGFTSGSYGISAAQENSLATQDTSKQAVNNMLSDKYNEINKTRSSAGEAALESINTQLNSVTNTIAAVAGNIRI